MKELLIILAQVIQIALPILFAVTLHEVSHGWAALKLGDSTAKLQGRLSINPLKHIDPIGTVVVPAVLYFLGGFIFGWAKPVPVSWQNLNKPQRDMALVAIAGPLANLIMLIAWALLAKTFLMLGTHVNSDIAFYFSKMSEFGMLINLILMVLNLLPIPPLDGSRVLFSFASPKFTKFLAGIEMYGFLILVILLATGVLSKIIIPIISFLFNLTTYLFGL